MEALTRRVPEFIENRKKIVKILIDELFGMKLLVIIGLAVCEDSKPLRDLS